MSKLNPVIAPSRIDLVDALRGFALLFIVLLHNLEHYNLYFVPENTPQLLKVLDKGLWDISWFVMAGKAFSTFSLLFGFSYAIQLERQMSQQRSFGCRFAWRMFILILFAQFHALFYNGDILLIYAVVGLTLIPFSKLSVRTILIIATCLLLQPLEWWRVVRALTDASYVPFENNWKEFAQMCKPVMESGHFIETLASNISHGQLYNNLWQLDAGRLFQIPALFLFGIVLAREKLFIKSERSTSFWVRVATISLLALLVPLTLLKNDVPELLSNPHALLCYERIMLSLWNFTFMAALLSLFTLLWFYKGNGYGFQRFIIPYGRMSLTFYISQSIIGCAIYLNWGLGLYEYTGACLSLLIGVGIFMLQLTFAKWYFKRHSQGPLEWLWKKMTWIRPKSQSSNR